MPNIPCPHCGRQISDQSKRCFYCAKPLGGDAGDAGGDVEKRAKMLTAMYQGGVGLPTAPKTSRIERLRDEPLAVRLLAGVFIIPVFLFWPPLAWKWMKTIFRP